MNCIKSYRIIKYNQGIAQIDDDGVIIEKPLNIYINNIYYSTLMCTPMETIELGTGFLFSEGVISEYNQVSGVEKTEDSIFFTLNNIGEIKRTKRVITSGCGRGSVHIKMIYDEGISQVGSSYTVSSSGIFKYMREFNSSSELFLKTGGAHCCCLCDSSGIMLLSEDIGRHNALDKTVGKALIQNIDLSIKMLFTTGRVSSDILIKAGRAGIPVVVSHSAPTDFAVDTAKSLNMTLIGFVRGSRMNIYCGRERIVYD